MGRQNNTGVLTETLVCERLHSLGLHTRKPVPDEGVDIEVWCPERPEKKLNIQVKGRGAEQKNKRYRWFQIRTTKRQRERALANGLEPLEFWRKKASLVALFVFVSERYAECWVFNIQELEKIIECNRMKPRLRMDNLRGEQAEIDLDVQVDGVPLRETFNDCKEAWHKVFVGLDLPPEFGRIQAYSG